MTKKAIQLTSAMNKATITIERDDVASIQNVSTDNNNGNAKVLTKTSGNFYVNETEEQVSRAVFDEVLVVK